MKLFDVKIFQDLKKCMDDKDDIRKYLRSREAQNQVENANILRQIKYLWFVKLVCDGISDSK